jgi:Arc/MetJ-type ribon-helix-helix transcriptional regulator
LPRHVIVYSRGMRTARTISITLPPDLLIKAQQVAQKEHRTISELFREALRRYMQQDDAWGALLDSSRAKGRAMGIHSEEDVERMSDEFRRDKQSSAPR